MFQGMQYETEFYGPCRDPFHLVKYPPDPMPEPSTSYWQGGDLWIKTEQGLERWRITDSGFKKVPIK
jgi:hypothetical protein